MKTVLQAVVSQNPIREEIKARVCFLKAMILVMDNSPPKIEFCEVCVQFHS